MTKPTFGSLFAGIGGFDLGLERAGWECRWQVEIDDFCNRVLEKHWPHVKRYRDIRELREGDLEPVDLVCGGFPCQDLSCAGKRAGLDGQRSSLWFEMLRVIRMVRPRYVLVENVAGLFDGGLLRVLRGLAESGYDAGWRPLRAADFGAWHARERVFVLANANGERLPESWFSGPDASDYAPEAFGEADRLVDAVRRNALPFLCGRHDGFRGGLDETHKRLAAIGNAVVPQVAEWIGERILEAR